MIKIFGNEEIIQSVFNDIIDTNNHASLKTAYLNKRYNVQDPEWMENVINAHVFSGNFSSILQQDDNKLVKQPLIEYRGGLEKICFYTIYATTENCRGL